jgi:hypothetical protein
MNGKQNKKSFPKWHFFIDNAAYRFVYGYRGGVVVGLA